MTTILQSLQLRTGGSRNRLPKVPLQMSIEASGHSLFESHQRHLLLRFYRSRYTVHCGRCICAPSDRTGYPVCKSTVTSQLLIRKGHTDTRSHRNLIREFKALPGARGCIRTVPTVRTTRKLENANSTESDDSRSKSLLCSGRSKNETVVRRMNVHFRRAIPT